MSSNVHPLFVGKKTPHGVYITHKQAIALSVSVDTVNAIPFDPNRFASDRGRLLCLRYHVIGAPVPYFWNAASILSGLVNS